MNVAFVFSLQNVFSAQKPLQYQEEIAFGISYISALLKKHGHKTRLFVITQGTDMKNVKAFIDEFCPDVMCMTAVATEFSFIAKWAEKIKEEYPLIYLAGGGCHISLNPEDALKSSFDAVCIGEGEYPILELVEQLASGKDFSNIANLWIKCHGDVKRNSPRPFIENLDTLPFPDREMWQEWIADANSRPVILLGRGCPFQCTYCSNYALSKVAPGRYVRFRSYRNILQELKGVVASNPTTDEVYFEVETFGVDKSWAINFCRKLEEYNHSRQRPLSFGVNLRVTPKAGLEPLFKAMQGSNFRFINIGLESGSQRLRREVMKRNYSNQDVVDAVKLARKYGLKIHMLNMIGLPGETVADIEETIRCNRVCQPDIWASHFIFFPYPGTEIHKMCQAEGLLPENIDTERERLKPVLNLPGLSKKTIQHYFVWFDYYVYKGYRPLFKILVRVLMAWLRSSYRLIRIYHSITEYGAIKTMKEVLQERVGIVKRKKA